MVTLKDYEDCVENDKVISFILHGDVYSQISKSIIIRYYKKKYWIVRGNDGHSKDISFENAYLSEKECAEVLCVNIMEKYSYK